MSPSTFEDKTLETTGTFITDEEPTICQFLYPSSLYQYKNTAGDNL